MTWRATSGRPYLVEQLEKSLVQLSIEWYTMGEENKKFASAAAVIQEQRTAAILTRMKNMVRGGGAGGGAAAPVCRHAACLTQCLC